MTDDIYDYFGGNSPKKVEPIDDDDFNSLDDPLDDVQAAAKPASPAAAVPATDSTISTGGDLEIKPSPETAPKSESHWDSLLGMLGIKRDPAKKEVAASAEAIRPNTPVADRSKNPAADVRKKTVVAKEPPKTKRERPSSRSESRSQAETPAAKPPSTDFFGFDPIPSPEDDTILPSMFQPTPAGSQTPNLLPADNEDLAGFQADSELPDDLETVELTDDGDEYLEFEIEDLDVSPYSPGEEEAFGRRRRSNSDRNERGHSDSSRSDSSRNDSSRNDSSRNDSSRNDSSRNDSSRSDSSRERSNREPASESRPERSPRGGGRPSKNRNEDRDSLPDTSLPKKVARSESDLSVEPNDDSIDPENPPKRRRRRSRGRGRTKQHNEVAGSALEPESSNQNDSDTSAEFVDEIGWESPTRSKPEKPAFDTPTDRPRESDRESVAGRGSSSNRGRSRPESRDKRDSQRDSQRDSARNPTNSRTNRPADVAEGVSAELPESGETTSAPRRRRRRRGGRSSHDTAETADRLENQSARNDDGYDEELVDHSSSKGSYDGYDDDADEDFVDDDFTPEEQSARRGPQRSSSRAHSDDDDSLVSDRTSKTKFPTWAEAISSLVESNIKNHSRTPSRGRGRGSSGGGNRGRSR